MPAKTYRAFLNELLGPSCARVVFALYGAGEASVHDLALQLEVTPNAVRRHLARLGRMGFLERRREPGRVGRPAYRFRLTAKAEGLFPSALPRVALLLTQLALEGKSSEARPRVARWLMERVVLEGAGEARHEGTPEALEGAGSAPRERGAKPEAVHPEGAHPDGTQWGEAAGPAAGLSVLTRRLEKAGFMPRVSDRGRELSCRHCPFGALPRSLPELCEAERDFLERLVGEPIRRVAWRLGNATACAYRLAPGERG
ncbi:MAG: helix-turn-helix transcriptional regulator [Gemmatimonadota bacterium]